MNAWKAEGLSNREIGRRLGIDEKAVRKLAGRLGWKQRPVEQMKIPLESADPNLSVPAVDQGQAHFSLDLDPADRSGDRLLARLGLLDDAAPIFGPEVRQASSTGRAPRP